MDATRCSVDLRQGTCLKIQMVTTFCLTLLPFQILILIHSPIQLATHALSSVNNLNIFRQFPWIGRANLHQANHEYSNDAEPLAPRHLQSPDCVDRNDQKIEVTDNVDSTLDLA